MFLFVEAIGIKTEEERELILSEIYNLAHLDEELVLESEIQGILLVKSFFFLYLFPAKILTNSLTVATAKLWIQKFSFGNTLKKLIKINNFLKIKNAHTSISRKRYTQ